MLSRNDPNPFLRPDFSLSAVTFILIAAIVFTGSSIVRGQSAPPTPEDYPIEGVGVIYEGGSVKSCVNPLGHPSRLVLFTPLGFAWPLSSRLGALPSRTGAPTSGAASSWTAAASPDGPGTRRSGFS
jgi:hypothetical protein